MKKKILVIEDEVALQKAVIDFLLEEGFDVFGALDGETGLRLAKKEKPDLILLDIVLPIKNGFEVLAELRQDSELKNSLVILLTNSDTSENIQKAFEYGVSTYLVKANYRLEDIVKKVRETLKM
jgi:DNA-binding response OmpR family regulator